MALRPQDKFTLRAIIENIQCAISCAADPHIDCRDQAHAHMEAALELVDELFEPDDQGDVPHVAGGADRRQEGGAS